MVKLLIMNRIKVSKRKDLNMDKRKYRIFVIIFMLLLFNDVIEYYLGGFSLIDEIYSIIGIGILCICLVMKKITFKISKYEAGIILMSFIILVIGFLGNYFSGYQNNIHAIEASLTTIKFICAYFVTKSLFGKFNLDDYKIQINRLLRRLTILLLTVGMIVNFFNPNRFYDSFYNKFSLIMFFSHATYLNAYCVSLVSLLTYYLSSYKKNYIYICMLLSVMIFTFKAKALMFVGIYLLFMLYYLFKYKSKKYWFLGRSILIFSSVPVLLLVSKFFYDKVFYFTVTYGDTARNVLTKMSIVISKSLFPIGLGFGTFGSAISGKYYSYAYYDFGMSKVYGLYPEDPKYVSDTFWPMILGELGFIGFFSVILIIILIILEIIKNKNKSKYWFSAFIPLIYLLISSLAESSFVNPMAICLIFILVIINNTCNINKNMVKNKCKKLGY